MSKDTLTIDRDVKHWIRRAEGHLRMAETALGHSEGIKVVQQLRGAMNWSRWAYEQAERMLQPVGTERSEP